MSEKNKIQSSNDNDDFKKLLEKNSFKIPSVGELVKGIVIAASKSEVRLDIDGVLTGVVRGPELYEEDDDYVDLKLGNGVEATVIELENENGDLELSFRYAGQEKAWTGLNDAYENKKIIKVKVIDANKGGLLVKYRQIDGFLPVSQLAPENYPRVGGGDKGKILEKLRSFVGKEFITKVMTLDEREGKIIFSEKEAWHEKQKNVVSKYSVGTEVEGAITAITDFGVFMNFGENLEGLIHISELAWQRIDNPADLYKVGDKIKARVISMENTKIFLSAKKLVKDPWQEIDKKYKIGQTIQGSILKVNPFGLFVRLDKDIHGLAHISQLGLAPKQKINEKFQAGKKLDFKIVSIEPKDHRLGLAMPNGGKQTTDDKKQKANDGSSSAPSSAKAVKGRETAGDKKVLAEKGDKKESGEDKKREEKKDKKNKKESKKTIKSSSAKDAGEKPKNKEDRKK